MASKFGSWWQKSKLSSWWQKIKQHRVSIGVVGIVLVVVVALIIAGYWFDWTGFNGYNKITIAHTISGASTSTVIRTEEYQPGKTLWDWLQLLIAPAVISLVGLWFTRIQQQRDKRLEQAQHDRDRELAKQQAEGERKAAEQRAQTERDIATDNQREAALQAYFDRMTELMLEYRLQEKSQEDVATATRLRTLTLLRGLDSNRKKTALQFLYEAGLLAFPVTLRDIDLSEVNLNGIILSQADLSEANLSGLNLNEANLSGAKLKGANGITNEELEKQALSLQDATMPDGSIHP